MQGLGPLGAAPRQRLHELVCSRQLQLTCAVLVPAPLSSGNQCAQRHLPLTGTDAVPPPLHRYGRCATSPSPVWTLCHLPLTKLGCHLPLTNAMPHLPLTGRRSRGMAAPAGSA